jgi:cytochrome c oxidase assembly protein subunit 15
MEINSPQSRPIQIWLLISAAMVFCMAVIGAITRLTESGLSIADWKPLIGALPPLSEKEWNRVFDLYKQIPEYQQVNSWMGLEDFKKIFFWEWFHRLFGRVIGLVYALPLLVFWVKKQIPEGFKGRLLFILGLGFAQGFMGWFMVMSGLSERTDVSHYRLAAHLGLAVLIYAMLIWTWMDMKYGPAKWSFDNFCIKRHGLISITLLAITMVWGAFTAGLNGGFIYNTWPLMGGTFMPAEVKSLTSIFENGAAVQFTHRWLAILTGFMILTYAWRVKAGPLAGMTFVQIALGIATVLLVVPIPLAAAHQAGALILLALLLFALHKHFATKLS